MRINNDMSQKINFKMQLKKGPNIAKAIAGGKAPDNFLKNFEELRTRLALFAPSKPAYVDYIYYPEGNCAVWTIKPFEKKDDFIKYTDLFEVAQEEDILKQPFPITSLSEKARGFNDIASIIWNK
jgi:hypothetical protein